MDSDQSKRSGDGVGFGADCVGVELRRRLFGLPLIEFDRRRPLVALAVDVDAVDVLDVMLSTSFRTAGSHHMRKGTQMQLHTRTNARMHSTHPRTHIHTPGTISRPGTTQRPVEHAKVQQTRVFFEAANAHGTQRSIGVYIPRVHYAVRGMRLGKSGAWRLPNYGP